jgi:hypothetical protein
MPHEDLHGVPFYLTKLTSPRSDALRVIKLRRVSLNRPGFAGALPSKGQSHSQFPFIGFSHARAQRASA